jgi:hypothetical protein
LVGLLSTVQPLSNAAAWFGSSRSFVRGSIANNPGKAKMEIIAVHERECKLKQELRLTDSSVRTGIKGSE